MTIHLVIGWASILLKHVQIESMVLFVTDTGRKSHRQLKMAVKMMRVCLIFTVGLLSNILLIHKDYATNTQHQHSTVITQNAKQM